jgi:type I restriction enzyme S subunit
MVLKDIAYYVDASVSSDSIELKQYVTTDSLLQNKEGKTDASNLPPQPCSLTHFLPEDVLVANIRPYLKKVWMADIEGGCSKDVLVIRAKGKHNAEYIYALSLQDTFFENAMLGKKGTKMPRGDKDKIMEYPVLGHCEDDERKVGHIISCIQRKIIHNTRINAELEAMAKRLYDYWFVQFNFPDGNGKPYKSSGGKMVYNEKLKREIPVGWDVDIIGNLLDKVTSTPRLQTEEYDMYGKYPIIDQTTDVYFAGFTNRADAVLTQYPAVVFGDHSCAVKYVNFPFVRGADGTQIMLSKIENVSIEYLYFTVKNIKISKGYARHYGFLKDSLIIIPSLQQANDYKVIAERIFKQVSKKRYETQRLVHLRDYLLPMLMNGQVTVE